MAANKMLVKKVTEALADVTDVTEKKMFSGIAFMVNKKLCIAVREDNVMLRI